MKVPGKAADAALVYRVKVGDIHAHLFSVSLTIARPDARQTLRLPVWIPGSYLVREFSKNLQRLHAHQATRPCVVRQCDKNTWEVDCDSARPLVVEYEIYALDNSVRAASTAPACCCRCRVRRRLRTGST